MKPFIRLESGEFKAYLSAARLEELLPHEETVEVELKHIIDDLKKEKMQRDPIIADISSGTVLDGMHRLEALKNIGAKFVITCFVDYNDPNIKVGRWLRASERFSDCKALAEILGMKMQGETSEILEKVDLHQIPAALVKGDTAYFVDNENRSKQRYPKEMVKKFDEYSKGKVSFFPDSNLGQLLKEKLCFFYPVVATKDQIIDSAKRRELFPPKSTRHEVPLRPVGVNFPLELLCIDDQNRANSELRSMLEKRKANYLRPGSEFHGRIYREALISYEDQG